MTRPGRADDRRARGLRGAQTLTLLVLLALAGCSGGDERAASALPPHPPIADEPPPRHRHNVERIETSADGRRLVTLGGDEVHVWALPGWRLVGQGRVVGACCLDAARRVALSRDGGQLVIQVDDRLWHWSGGEMKPILSPGMRPVRRLIGFTPDDALLWVDRDGDLNRWTQIEGLTRLPPPAGGPLTSLSWVSGDPARGYLLWAAPPRWVTFDEDARVQVTPVTLMSLGSVDQPPVGDARARQVYAVQQRALRRLDVEASALRPIDDASRPPIPPRERVVSVALSLDGRWLAVGYEVGLIDLWEVSREGARPGPRLRLPEGLVRDVYIRRLLDLAFSEDGLWVLLPEQRLVRFDTQTWLADAPRAL